MSCLLFSAAIIIFGVWLTNIPASKSGFIGHVVTIHFPISSDKDAMMAMIQRDSHLACVANWMRIGAETTDIEVFYQEGNLVITEKGYHFTVYEKELDSVWLEKEKGVVLM